MNIKSDITWRIVVCYAAMVVFGIAIIYQVLHIQLVEGKYWRSKEDSATLKYVNIYADRGNIYSEDGRLIATSLPNFEIHFDAQADGLTDELFDNKVDSLSILLNEEYPTKSIREYRQILVSARRNAERYQLLLKDISYPQLLQIKKWPLFKLGQNRGGLLVKQINKRLYPYDNLALRTIGYVRDNSPIAVGIEAAYNGDLTGTPGKQLMRKISGGIYIPLNNNFVIEPKNGKDIITTLDVSLQDEAEHALEKTLIANNAEHGSVIVMEVKTGKIKALANMGRKIDGTYDEIFNYAIRESREPGSTFKIASLLALLEDGYVNLNDTVDVEAGIHKYGPKQIMRDAEEHGFRRISVIKAFAISSNVGVSKLVSKYYAHQPERYLEHLHNWHLDQLLGIEIPGESAPEIKNTTNKYWSAFSLPWMSVGYELKVSPLNMCTLYNAIANNGIMVKPYLVSEVDEYGKPIKKYTTTIINKKICSDSTLRRAHKLLEAVVNYGTASGLKNPFYTIAGKTGTALITDNLKDSTKKAKEYQSSFCGYFPANNPIYTICVVINRPSKGVYYGAKVAGPVFKEIADKVYANVSRMQMTDTIVNTHSNQTKLVLSKGYKSDIKVISKYISTQVIDSSDGEWSYSSENHNYITLHSLVNKDYTIPDVKGMGIRDALYLLENAGLTVRVVGAGIVRQQSLKAGQNYKKGQIIIITLI